MRNRTSSLVLPAFCALLLAGVFSGCSSSEGEEKAKNVNESPKKDSTAAPAATFQLEKGQLSTDLFVPGELIAFQQVDLYAKVNSFVRKLYVDVGSEVKEGQLLATMEAPELQSQLASAESRVKSQEAIYIASKSNYDRVIETSKTPGTISQNDVDQADARQKSDMAQWDAAKSAYKEVAET
ncbi:MAG TPA: biotin/lipoyl-binding protein, partial [Puia sp.]|nr:biotin/lipoyl-binding protein [Puia sp.]